MAKELLREEDPDKLLLDFTHAVGGYESIIVGIQALAYGKIFRGTFEEKFATCPECGLNHDLVGKQIKNVIKGLIKMEAKSNDQFDDEATPAINNRIADKVLINEMIELLVRKVDEKFLTPLILAEHQELSYAEIAELMGIPENTVASRIYRGKKQARDVLEANGYSFELLQNKAEYGNRNTRNYHLA